MTQLQALLVLSVVQFVTVNAICNSCQNDEDCVDFCNDLHGHSVCENKVFNNSQSMCCVCKGRVRRHSPSPCSSDRDCTTHHCHSSSEKPYCDHTRGHCECAHCFHDSDCSGHHCPSTEKPYCSNHFCECTKHGWWSTWSVWSGCSEPVGPGSFLGIVPVQITCVADTLERPVLVTELHALSSTPYGVDGAPGRHAAPHVEQGLTFGPELVMGCTLARAIPRNRGPVKTVFVVR
uniref:Uncharacterized protein LOC111127875 n=1 Tax=Crassostrea virginica TaxID=6565 RepID=A0A8B8DPF8_CRAVI|nr:uncharacterized protein LOC111127875 [Crassostrea virginica]